MNIFITGATGFIGKALVNKWLADNHQITLLSRNPERAKSQFPQPVSAVKNLDIFEHFNDFDAVINLAGEPIFDQRWTNKQKSKLWHSRIDLTEKLTALINQSQTPPDCFISASATGFYGDAGENLLTENSAASQCFTGLLCQAWENAANQAHTRVCTIRTGMPLARSGGALGRMLKLYQWGLGGKLGNGKQFMPWIALQDMVAAVNFLMQNNQCQGAFNMSSPNPIRNQNFNSILGSQLNRPHFAHAPAWLLRLLLGERAKLVLDSQRVYPEKLQRAGFQFQFEDFEHWLATELK
ncbi:hypothetical protein C8D76_11239 [Pasteurella langaaensis DSM 22999]|uniref:TIGR01777 family protein n=1 Tax=Alitibacter langaaensis DSM 22999 TaxID=1122935 RepID=A0A2U0SMV7_9PAST|nr:TIGR01777 family oxidoreductase [Pasteurella langaaensis]PVX32678.1 hypothetical protein C8D76_11239 [Pasteurella langaaensis DSM 22999]